MKSLINATLKLWALAAAIVAVAGLGVADAATGGSLILGQKNTAGAVTTLKNSNGTALSLVAPSSSPPLAVSNSKKVSHLNADLLDGLDSTKLQAAFKRTIVVSPASTAAASGTALLNAMGAISSTNTKPSLVYVEPGTYNLGGSSLEIKPNVELAGGGESVTTITSAVDSGSTNPPLLGTVMFDPPSALRGITVRNTSSSSGSTSLAGGAETLDAGAIEITDATFESAGNSPNGNFAFELNDANFGPLLADGDTFDSIGSTKAYGIDALEGQVKVRNSIVTGATNSVIIEGGSAFIATSQVSGPTSGAPKCVDDFDSIYTAIADGSCP